MIVQSYPARRARKPQAEALMYLRSLLVQNYRAIREGVSHLRRHDDVDRENDCGRSSILEALSLVLGRGADGAAFAFQPHHFHRGDGGVPGPIRIEVELAERRAGEWELPESLTPAYRSFGGARRVMLFEVIARLDAATSSIVTTWRMRAGPGSRPTLQNDAALLAWVRRCSPMVWMREGIVAWDRPARQRTSTNAKDAEMRRLAEKVEEHYRNLLSASSAHLQQELDSGFEAAKAILDRNPLPLAGEHLEVGATLREITGRDAAGSTAPLRLYGTASQKIGLLLLTGALLTVADGEGSPDARPVIVIEDPEVHLHPMTLAVIWRVLERFEWQKIIATHSGTLLANAPVSSIRRLTRRDGVVHEWRIPPRRLGLDDLRRLTYHVRSRRAAAMFARCWLLVEGETEFWLLPELARACGYDFGAEGIVCVEFAQCGLDPLIKVAENLGIEWHLVADGDAAGRGYADSARRFIRKAPEGERITLLAARDIEHCFWEAGFEDVFARPC